MSARVQGIWSCSCGPPRRRDSVYFESADLANIAQLISAVAAGQQAVWSVLAFVACVQTGLLVGMILGWVRRGSD